MARNLKPAVDLIKKWEGLFLKAYKDPVGIPTIGYGTIRYPSGVKVQMGDTCTKEQAEAWLEHHIKEACSPTLDTKVKVSLNDNQYGALASFIYNCGSGAFSSSTLLKKLNANDISGAANEFLKWNKAGGKVLKGLVNRRAEEKALFLTPAHVTNEAKPVPNEVVLKPQEKSFWQKLIDWIFGDTKALNKEAKLPPDDVETGAPAKVVESPIAATQTLSAGNGPRITKERVEEILRANNCDTSKFCMLAIRGYYLDTYGVVGENDRGVYDDAIILYWGTGFYTYRANCDASSYRKGTGFGAEKGMAMLKKGVWFYQKGIHKTYWAFTQADKVTVVRDGTKGNYEDTGWFGINIHRGGASGTSSLGCQTFIASQWEDAKTKAYGKLDERKQKTFQYCLVEEKDLRAGNLKVN